MLELATNSAGVYAPKEVDAPKGHRRDDSSACRAARRTPFSTAWLSFSADALWDERMSDVTQN